ncbi:MAG: helix-turn-helix transcriptional regulator [Proteobacteria bacterium]|nr:helix-turn-helix transcriptional regulator [Pseudomonadota bacterium]
MKKKSVKVKSWVEKKLEDKDFRKGFATEYAKLSIGEQLAALRAFAKLTQAQVAKKAGTTASAISRYENAEYDRYELQTLRKIVEACGGKIDIVVTPSSKKKVA